LLLYIFVFILLKTSNLGFFLSEHLLRKFEDTIEVTRSQNSKDRQCNGQ